MTRTAGSRNKEADEHQKILDEATEWQPKHILFQTSIIKEKKKERNKKKQTNKTLTYLMFEIIRIFTVTFSGCHCLFSHMGKRLLLISSSIQPHWSGIIQCSKELKNIKISRNKLKHTTLASTNNANDHRRATVDSSTHDKDLIDTQASQNAPSKL